jgi:hypothetical protein
MNKKIIAAIIISTASTVAFAGEHKNGHHHGMKVFSLIDTNTDDLLSKEEVLSFHGQRFADMDADSDGFVSKAEMKAHRKQQRRDKKDSRDQQGSDTES